MLSTEQAVNVIFEKGKILVVATMTTAVQYLDCISLFGASDSAIYVTLVSEKNCRLVPVESTSPAVTPTTAATTGNARMAQWPAWFPKSFVLERANHVIAHSANGGMLTVERTSAPTPAWQG